MVPAASATLEQNSGNVVASSSSSQQEALPSQACTTGNHVEEPKEDSSSLGKSMAAKKNADPDVAKLLEMKESCLQFVEILLSAFNFPLGKLN